MYAPGEATGGEVLLSTCQKHRHAPDPPDSNKGRTSVHDRMRVPVSDDDLFKEGEIQE